jgi:ketosteroid isomerase-like protein
MKRLAILTIFIMFASFSFNIYAQKKDVKQDTGNTSDQPYKVGATNITLGNQAYAQKVLWAWKYYDDNTLDKAADLFADDVLATLPDGTVIKGKDNLMKGLKDYRNSFASAASTVDACVTLKTPDVPDREVVSIWGVETDTNKDGTVSKVHLNEVWFFNKEGKVVEFHQLRRKKCPTKIGVTDTLAFVGSRP